MRIASVFIHTRLLLNITHIDLERFAVRILNCWIIALNPNILNELSYYILKSMALLN
jgi:hypothetical protein